MLPKGQKPQTYGPEVMVAAMKQIEEEKQRLAKRRYRGKGLIPNAQYAE